MCRQYPPTVCRGAVSYKIRFIRKADGINDILITNSPTVSSVGGLFIKMEYGKNMTDRMSKQPVIIGANGTQKLNRISLNNGTFREEWLQSALEETPSILPTAEIAPIFAPLICVAREVRLKTDDNNSGRIDNLYISKHGHLVIVETKLWNNPEARREVIGQILDYAKEVKEWNYDKLNSVYRAYPKTTNSVFDALVAAGYQSPESEADFIDTVNQNIRSAQFLLMIVGDGIRSSVEKIAEYINASPEMQHRLALCELEVYDLGDGRRMIVPQLTTKTTIIERGIIRIENGNIKINLDTPENDNENTDALPAITQDDLIKAFTQRNKKVSANQMLSFLEDLEDLGLLIKYTPLSASVYCPIKSLNTYVQVFVIPGKPGIKHTQDTTEALPWFVPNRILKRMETLGLITAPAKQLFEALRPVLAKKQKAQPYEDYAKFYFLDNTIFTNPEQRQKLLTALEEFQNEL